MPIKQKIDTAVDFQELGNLEYITDGRCKEIEGCLTFILVLLSLIDVHIFMVFDVDSLVYDLSILVLPSPPFLISYILLVIPYTPIPYRIVSCLSNSHVFAAMWKNLAVVVKVHPSSSLLLSV